MSDALAHAPWGYDTWTHTEVVPKPPPIVWRWRIGLIRPKVAQPEPSNTTGPFNQGDITVQLTADQQVGLSISGEDSYGNPIDLSGADAQWVSSDESVIQVDVDDTDKTSCTAIAVGPVGTASVTVSGGTSQQYQGSIAIDVVAGNIAEIVVTAGEPEDKP